MHKFKFMRQLEMVSFATSDKIWFIIILVPFLAYSIKVKIVPAFYSLCCARTQKYAKVCVIVGWRGRPLQRMKKQ